jgi:hypothetical protein
MHLSCQNFCLILLCATFGCSDAIEPSPKPVSRLFVLQSVDNRPLPTIISAGAGDTTQVLWSTVTLDSTGQAVTVHHLSHAYLQYGSEENTYTLRQQYRLKADSIEIGGFGGCPPGAMCVGNLHGKLTDSTLAIAEFYNPYPSNPIIYLYHLAQTY